MNHPGVAFVSAFVDSCLHSSQRHAYAMQGSAVLIFIVLLIATAAAAACLRPLLSAHGNAHSHRKPFAFCEYLENPIHRLAKYFLFAYAGWLGFYVFLALDGPPSAPPSVHLASHWVRLFQLIADAMTNVTSLSLVFLYFELSAFDRGGPSRRHEANSRLTAWMFLTAAFLIYELLWLFAGQAPLEGSDRQPLPFKVVYGLGQATALFLVIGRLDSSSIREHIRAGKKTSLLGLDVLHKWGIPVGYAYASIQPLYVLFDNPRSWVPIGLVWLALVFKLYLLYWICRLFTERSQTDKPSAIEHHLFETSRYRVEEGTSFERTFLRRHLNPIYRRRFREREIGYLGVEYAYLSELKLGALYLGWVIGAVLVRRVYPGTSAIHEGIRPGDFITAIDGMPLTSSNRLSNLLVGSKPGSHVEVTALRKADPGKAASPEDCYQELRFVVELHDYEDLIKSRVPPEARTKLGCSYLYDSRKVGVVCSFHSAKAVTIVGVKSRLTERYYDTPDVQMLRFALENLIAGEDVEVVVESGQQPPDPAPSLRMECETSKGTNHGPLVHDVGIPTFREMKDADRAELLRLYPDRFGDGGRGYALDRNVLQAYEQGCLLTFFDEHYAHVCDNVIKGSKAFDRIKDMKIWEHIHPGEMHGHASVLPASGPLDKAHPGGFFSFDLTRKIDDPRTLAEST